MESGNNHASHENIWHQQQQIAAGDPNKQFYMNHYQPMQHGFDLQREIAAQPSPTTTATPENVHFLRDNNGPYVKIYYSDNKEYELFERSQQPENQVFMNNVDMFNNFLPNTQMPFQSPMPPQMMNQPPQKNNTTSSSVIHHLVTSNLGPGKFEFGTFGGHNNNATFSTQTTTAPLNISIPALLEQVNTEYKSNSNNNNLENGASITSPEMSPLQHQPQMTSNNTSAPPTVNINKKQRIVAEVKPYKLSYSDVLSKNGANVPVSASSGHSNSTSSSPNTTMPTTNSKPSKMKYQSTSTGSSNNGSFEKKHQENGSGNGSADKNRKSPTSPIVSSAFNNSTEVKRTQPTAIKVEKQSPPPPPLAQSTNQSQNAKKKKQPTNKDSLTVKSTSQRTEAVTSKYATDSEEQSSTIDTDNDEIDNDDDTTEFYDIRKNVYSGEHHKVEKIKSYKKTKVSATTASASKKGEKSQKRMSNNKSTTRKQKHKFLEKLVASCIEYLLIFVKWLWMLIYDVSYLSTGILWDRMNVGYQYALQGVSYVKRELRGNPGRAFIAWIKNTWKKFDSKFDKKSKWAFWRWMFKKQSSSEHAKDYYKDGKLPKTAEEAMKSLLNCKEKDAYSILGVSPDCPQEQIKKHYKKIAVLVHPDKNKQAGAEEAFKVLQRSCELIGEPESRRQYDESLAKALHTEKAFNELNDLLIQLQTKISEAANTIRCSSCCFRHPRKPTGRKPFAARECSTCKIRHSAREGDIWAETTFFGLRWKYLALMEGNVYDITEWALCQRGALSHLQANSCVVQYKIVLGGNQQNQNQSGDRERFNKKDAPVHEPQEDFFLNNIYAGQQHQHQNAKRRFKKN